MKRSRSRLSGASGASGLLTLLMLGVAIVLATGCSSAAPAAQSAPSARQDHGHSARSARQNHGHSARQSPGTSCGGASASASGSRQPRVLGGVQFVSASDGWVAGSDRILHTADGGRSWVVQFRTSQVAQLATVDFVDASHGWVTGASELLATADGGAHWRALPEPCGAIQAVHFISPEVGFAVAGGDLSGAGLTNVPLTGGLLLQTNDGGQHWHRLATPSDVQTACFSDSRRGWLGAGGNIYGTVNGGRDWTLAVRARAPSGMFAEVECAGSGSGWAEVIGPGAAMSHEPHVGYHTSGTTWQPIFAEQYTASPGLRARVPTASPSTYPGPFSAISPDQAVFIGWCPPCSAPASPRLLGPAPMDVALHDGAVLLRRGRIAQLSQATAAAFVTASDGWVTGIRQGNRTVSVIMHTGDGGRSWQEQYVLAG